MKRIISFILVLVITFGISGIFYAYTSEYLKNSTEKIIMKTGSNTSPSALDVTKSLNNPKISNNIKTTSPGAIDVNIPAETKIKVYYEGKELKFTLPIITRNYRTYYPFGELVESLGGTVSWNESTRTAIGMLIGNSVEFTIGSSEYKPNGRTLPMDAQVFVENGRTYVPIRYACEGLGFIVTWNQPTNSILLTLKPPLTVDISSLNKYIKSYNGAVSVYYENIKTGYSYAYNADKLYFAASVIKAPYCLYIYQLAEKSQTNLNSVHTYTSADYRGGTGVIKNMKVGTKFTEHQLLKYAIRNSDNIAFRLLIKKYGTDNFKNYISSIGGNPSNIRTVTGANISAGETGLYAREIHTYIESGGKYSNQFKTDLMSTSNPMIVSGYPIARKYGWATKSFHDMAIVYSDSPYILVIMSAKENGTSADFKAFKDISMTMQNFNKSNFSQ